MELFPPSRHTKMAFDGNKAFLDGYSDGPAQVPHSRVVRHVVPQATSMTHAARVTYATYATQPNDLAFEYPAEAEDKIDALAAYYGVPTVSLRGALFREMKARSRYI